MRAFGIIHFAGTVFYSADGFLEKNRDTFSNDLFDLLGTTRNEYLKILFKGAKAMVKLCSKERRPWVGIVEQEVQRG